MRVTGERGGDRRREALIAAPGTVPTVTLLGRPGCHLCEDARAELLELQRSHPFALEERDIERDPALLRAHLERIPVVLVDGEEVSHLFLDPPALVRRLDRVP